MLGKASIEEKDGRVLVHVRVQPKASRNAVHADPGGRIRVALTAPPVEGEANKALLVFLAKTLDISRAALVLVSGEKSREKTVEIHGLKTDEVMARLLGQ